MIGLTGIGFAPLIPWPAILVLAAIAVALTAFGLMRGARGILVRVVAFGVLVLALFNPRLESETREPQKDVAIIVVDESGSQATGNRRDQAKKALQELEKVLARFDDLEYRVVRGTETPADGTLMFGELSRAIAAVPKGRYAGAIMITDGQIHDAPAAADAAGPGANDAPAALPLAATSAPLHALLTGRPDERDRRLVIAKAPAFGIVGKDVNVAIRIEDKPGGQSRRAEVRIRVDRGDAIRRLVPIGVTHNLTIPIEHGGPTIVEIEVEAMKNEMSEVNNEALVTINGVRDRLRVLLVSGQPHAGERTWRNLLKSDPSVDLVHFTILRPPEKNDFTPLNELALISFPIRELFEVKLAEFDLIVFDRYVVRFVLPPIYFQNIERYVRDGGAVLAAVGPDFAGVRSLFHTPLGKIIPGQPTGKISEGGFRAKLTAKGRRHPVTAGLEGAEKWGRWFRQIDANARRGVTLMEGPGGKPLLLLDRVGEGRIAQFLSDHIWLWARGFDGGGPHAELLRRLSHWLMKEPDLEEEVLRARARGRKLTIERRSLSPEIPPVTVAAPSGAEEIVTLEPAENGAAETTITAAETGLYRISDGTRTALAVVGALNPPELSDLRAAADKIAPLVKASGGGTAWITEGLPGIRRTRPGRSGTGQGWIGLTRNGAYVVTGVRQTSLLPVLLFLVLVLGGLMVSWWREGQ